MMLNAFKYAFEEDLEVVLRNFLLSLEEVKNEEPIYIELTNSDITEEDIIKGIEKLDGKGAVTMSILQIREEIGRREGIQRGRQEGVQKENLEIAKNLLKEGTEIALVIKATGLSKSEVAKLNEEVNN